VNYVSLKNRQGFLKNNHTVFRQKFAIFIFFSLFQPFFLPLLASFPPFMPLVVFDGTPNRGKETKGRGKYLKLRKKLKKIFAVIGESGAKWLWGKTHKLILCVTQLH
jgi:hypothetical protein